MIQDFDGPDPAPNRRGRVLVISVLLLVGVVAGYAAVSSPELRGPFATPRPLPSVVHAPVFTPALAGSIEPASIQRSSVACVVPGSGQMTTILTTTLVANGQTVITTLLPGTSSNPCAVQWGQPPNPIPYDRVSR